MTTPAAPSHRVPRRSRPGLGKLVCCAIIASISAWAIGLSVHGDIKTTAAALSRSSTDLSIRENMQELCLYQAIRRELPKGAAVYVDSTSPAQVQRLSELSTLWAVPEPTAADAEWQISFEYGNFGGGCYRLGLKVRQI